jgi:uncharacterized protein involved in exopolysaccharide biosynthesis
MRDGGKKTFDGRAFGQVRPQGSGARLAFPDILAMLWREKGLMALVAALVLGLGLVLALIQQRTYEAETRLLVRLGPEYVYQPNVGAVGAGQAPQINEVINSEIKLIGSPEVVRRTIERVGIGALYPDLAQNARGDEGARDRALAIAERAFFRSFSATTAPNTPIIMLSFEHPNAETAARTVNTLVAEYLAYRLSVLVEGQSEGLAKQIEEIATRSAVSADALQTFLKQHGIVDFEAEQKSLTELQARLTLDYAEAVTRRREMEGQAAALQRRMGLEPAEIELYAETDTGKRLIDLQVEREQLLARYLPDAAPVKDVERRIAQLEAYVAQERRASLARRGPNPVHQQIAEQSFIAESQARAMAARQQAIAQQQKAASERLRFLQDLQPQYQALARDKAVLEENARAFSARAEEARASSQISRLRSDNIRMLEEASPPRQGKSLRWPILIVAIGLAGALALASGLVRAFLRPNFPSAGSLARTLETPVLGVTLGAEPPKEKRAA